MKVAILETNVTAGWLTSVFLDHIESSWFAGSIILTNTSQTERLFGFRLASRLETADSAKELARAVSSLFNADFGIAVTGFMNTVHEVHCVFYNRETQGVSSKTMRYKGALDYDEFRETVSSEIYNSFLFR